MLKGVKVFATLLAGMFLGALILFGIYTKNLIQPVAKTDSTILLQNLKKVCKLVTVEGNVSNILDHKDYVGFDFYPLRKKAILKVDAKVSAGYDLEQLSFEIDEQKSLISIKNFPEAEILSVDMDVKYYDISESFFNSFSEEELNDLNVMAKDLITLNAYNSELMKTAETKAMEVLDIIRIIVETSGWNIVYEKEVAVPVHKH